MISQLLIVRAVVAIVLGKSAIFHYGLNGRRPDSTKWTLLAFSFFFFFFKAENSCSRMERERGDVSGGRWLGGREFLVGRFSVGSASLKKFPTSWLAKRCLVLLFRRPASLYRSTVYVNKRSNMHAVSVSFRNPLKYDKEGPWAQFYEILIATLLYQRNESDTHVATL